MSSLVIEAPVADWVTIPDLQADPFPALRRMRAEAAVHWVPAVNRYMVTRFEACHQVELDAETYSANETDSLMKRSMGHSMLRKDDPEHTVERAAWQPPLRPTAIKQIWQQVFEANTDRQLDSLEAGGPCADLVADFAAPLAAENLRQILGFRNADQVTMRRWSQTMIDATGNYADDRAVWEQGAVSANEVDAALEELIPYYRQNPDGSLISGLVNAKGYHMPLESIRANIKMTIGGGVNEPRDVLSVAAYALLQDRDQLAEVLADPSLWTTVFDEAIRWIAPIGLYPRQTTREVVLDGVRLPAGSRIGVCLLSANRDETRWSAPEVFDIHRPKLPHLAFGGGAHYCAGAWVAKSSVAGVGLPRLWKRFPDLTLDPERPARMSGWVFRGLSELPVTLTGHGA